MNRSFSASSTLQCPQKPRTATMLVIDDDPVVSQMIVCGFAPYNVEVLQAYNGDHGIWVATTEKPDVVITDIRMPQGNGDYVAECLRHNASTRHIPIIVLTGLLDESIKRRMNELGVDDYFYKPLEIKRLREAVRRFIEL